MSKDKISVRVELEGSILTDFERIKLERNFALNTEAIRYCITETAKEDSFSLDKEHVTMIRNIINNNFVRTNYSIFSIHDFIRKAIDNMAEEIWKNSESIQSFDVRMSLTEEENELALAIIDLQSQKHNEMFTVDDLVKFVNHRDKTALQEKLDEFVSRALLSKQIVQEKIYYHARK